MPCRVHVGVPALVAKTGCNISSTHLQTVLVPARNQECICVFWADSDFAVLDSQVLAKSLIDYLDTATPLESVTVADIMDPAYYVPQSMAVWNVLEEMRRRRIHMAIVVDEYGGTAGVCSSSTVFAPFTPLHSYA